ncbi:MAG: hypothetical protein EBV05_03805 [Cyanobacteria bacterium WB6_1B_304]|jgi:hypothetical protein|nr:hypothetical protein [Cyanobacteria bacterium WB6_1B_304]
MTVLICPGIHSADVTGQFLVSMGMDQRPYSYLVLPTPTHPPYSGYHVHQYLRNCLDPSHSLLLIAFSAGVVGAMTAASQWHRQHGSVVALIALDGWGVPHPMERMFPIHYLSHDFFTHWSCTLLTRPTDNFYADPAVPHMQLWRSPHAVRGVHVRPDTPPQAMTADHFLHCQIGYYQKIQPKKYNYRFNCSNG